MPRKIKTNSTPQVKYCIYKDINSLTGCSMTNCSNAEATGHVDK